jgi:arylsulfatase A-like enzyme
MATRKRGLDSRKLPEDADTLAERFRAAGRRTVGGAANPNAGEVFAFQQGFDSYFNPDHLWRDGGGGKVDGASVVDAVLDDLRAGEDGRPFYAQLLLVDAHEPYDQGDAWKAWKTPEATRRIALYRAMLAHLDTHLDRLERGLAALGHGPDDTLFVFVGDHGEGLTTPAHHGWGHGNYLYPSSVHVPLVMRGPGIPAGTQVQALTSSVDVLPTVLALAKLPAGTAVDGLDQSAWATGARGPQRPEALVASFFRGIDRAALYGDTNLCQRDFGPPPAPKKKRKRPPFPDACFDWRHDPDAVVPVEDPALNARLEAAHVALIADLDARDAGQVPDATLDQVTRDALERLGYLRDSDD